MSATLFLIFGVADAKSRKVCRSVRTGAKASALSSDDEPGVTLKIRSLASASSPFDRTRVTPAFPAIVGHLGPELRVTVKTPRVRFSVAPD